MILLIDNYDSFAHNLARYLILLGQRVQVVRNDALTVAGVKRWQPAAIVISPGPCTPDEAGQSLDLVAAYHTSLPILGVCLGHQVIAQALGGRVVRAQRPRHGQSSDIYHDGQAEFAGLPNPFAAARYHSLVVEATSLPGSLQPTAWTAAGGTGELMAVRHRVYPVVGWQFHPESILTEVGFALLARWLRASGLAEPPGVPLFSRELAPNPRTGPPQDRLWPRPAVTPPPSGGKEP